MLSSIVVVVVVVVVVPPGLYGAQQVCPAAGTKVPTNSIHFSFSHLFSLTSLPSTLPSTLTLSHSTPSPPSNPHPSPLAHSSPLSPWTSPLRLRQFRMTDREEVETVVEEYLLAASEAVDNSTRTEGEGNVKLTTPSHAHISSQHTLTHPLTHTLTHTQTHTLTHTLTHPITHTLTHPLTHTLIRIPSYTLLLPLHMCHTNKPGHHGFLSPPY